MDDSMYSEPTIRAAIKSLADVGRLEDVSSPQDRGHVVGKRYVRLTGRAVGYLSLMHSEGRLPEGPRLLGGKVPERE
jgi:hypothetical protein